MKQSLLPRILLAASLFASSPVFAAEAPIITGGLPRNLSTGTFTLVVTINGVTTEQKTKGDTEDPADPVERFGDRLHVILPGVDGDPLPLSSDAATTATKKFYVEEENPGEPEQNGDLWNYTYNIRISALDSADLKKYVDQGNGTLKVSVKFYLGAVEIQKLENFELKQESYVINAAPNLNSIVGTNRALRISWDIDTSVAIKGGTGEKAPAQVQIYLVDRAATTNADLPGRKFEPANAEGDPVDSCTFTDPGTGSGACITCPTDVYLDAEAIKSNPPAGFSFDAETNTTGFTQIAGLDNEKQYLVFLQYEPDGLQVSQCLAGQPSPDLSLTEANGEDEAEIVDFRCFIATAAYGSPLHKDLVVFRQFRDEVLMTNAPGRAAVSVYYKWSPGVARYIAAHPRLKAFVRSGLEVVAEVLR